MILPAPSTTRAAVPRAKLTGPLRSLFTTMVLPGVYVLTVPASYVVLVVVVVVAGAVVVCSVVVVLVCANATGAISAQAIVIMLFFIILSPILFEFAPATGPRHSRILNLRLSELDGIHLRVFADNS
jgi:hypothetical protein